MQNIINFEIFEWIIQIQILQIYKFFIHLLILFHLSNDFFAFHLHVLLFLHLEYFYFYILYLNNIHLLIFELKLRNFLLLISHFLLFYFHHQLILISLSFSSNFFFNFFIDVLIVFPTILTKSISSSLKILSWPNVSKHNKTFFSSFSYSFYWLFIYLIFFWLF